MMLLDRNCLSDTSQLLESVLAGIHEIVLGKTPPILALDFFCLGLLNQNHFLTVQLYRHGTIFQFGTCTWSDKHMQIEFFQIAKFRKSLLLDSAGDSE